jgi:hypothetical protein
MIYHPESKYENISLLNLSMQAYLHGHPSARFFKMKTQKKNTVVCGLVTMCGYVRVLLIICVKENIPAFPRDEKK